MGQPSYDGDWWAIVELKLFISQVASAQTLATISSWIGNSFGGAANNYVPNAAETMIVLGDGTCVTNTTWEDGGSNVTLLKDNRVLGRAGHTHGWGYEGGFAIAANGDNCFIAQRANHSESQPPNPATDIYSWPAVGRNWHGVSRRLRTDITQGAPFIGGKGGNGDTVAGSFLVVDEVPEGPLEQPGISGLVATATRSSLRTCLQARSRSMTRRRWHSNAIGCSRGPDRWLSIAPDTSGLCKARMASAPAPPQIRSGRRLSKRLGDFCQRRGASRHCL